MTSTRRQPIIAVRLRQLGDVLATLGTLRAIKSARPDTEISFVIDKRYHALLEKRAEYIDRLVPEPPHVDGIRGAAAYQRYVESLRELQPVCTLDFHCNTRSAILCYLTGATKRVGFDVRLRKALYTHVEPRALFDRGAIVPRTSHEAAMALARRAGFDVSHGTVVETLSVPEAERVAGSRALVSAGVDETALAAGRVVGLNPGNPYGAKEWPEKSFAVLARSLRNAGFAVVLLWGPGEKERCERIARMSRDAAVVAPPFSLDAMAGALRALSLLVTIDSGLKHLAVAVGVQTVTLFGPTSPAEWHMGGASDRVVTAGLSCSPCRLLTCPFDTPCMKRIEPSQVVDVVADVGLIAATM